jgi:AcrR family transcriptional regulator
MSVARSAAIVKRRPYDATARRAAADRQRERILDAAWERFRTDGFAATTVDAVAGDAGVSAATIYKSLGGKVGLVRALVTRALHGDPARKHAETRSDALRTGVADGRALIREWGALVEEVAPRVSPIVLLLREVAAADPEAAALYAEVEADRLARMADNAAAIRRLGGLRPGVSAADARDVLWTYTAPDLYDVLVRRRGWSVRRYARFVTEAMLAALT